MRIHVVVWRRERHDKAGEHVTEETITSVAPDAKGKPGLIGQFAVSVLWEGFPPA